MSLTIDAKDAMAAIQKYGAKVEAEIAKAVTATALEVNTDIKKRIQRGPKSGRTYNRRGVSHQASAPGEAPATDTGTLASSITFKQVSKLTAEVETRLAYGSFLEFGTQNIAPRPAWVPAVEEARPKFAKRVADAIRRAAP
jgi:hypothetical protein